MACFCSDKKKMDLVYVKKLATAESLTKKVDIQIYFTFGYDGKTKYYDYEESNGGRRLQVVEVIRFSEPESLDILRDFEFTKPDSVSDEEIATVLSTITGSKVRPKDITKRNTTKSANKDSGTVL